jgi:glycosyltransferase involved in cell wall biosynthesis
MSPSESEGLQNCPMEAALCGCPLVITDHPRAGGDYIIDNETCLVYRARDIVHGTEQVKRLLLDSNLRKRLNRNMIEWLRENVKTKAEAALIFEQELVK